MRYVLKANFDPISQSELEEAKKIAKEYGECYLSLEKDGILPYAKRVDLLKRAIAPFRHIHFLEQENNTDCIITMQKHLQDERMVRQGKFYLAAQGIKGILAKEGLYLNQILEANLKEKRIQHSIEVAKLSVELARYHDVDLRKAYIAGMLHDVTKHQSDAYHETILSIYDPDKLSYPKPIYHSFTAVVFLKQNLGIYDPEILNAIYHHTLGDGESKLDAILYIADKCERTRGYDSEYEIALSKKNLKDGRDLVLEEAKQYIELKKQEKTL